MVLNCEAVGKAEDDVVEGLNQCIDDDSNVTACNVVECNVIECDVVLKAICIVLNHVWQTEMGLPRRRAIYQLWQCLAFLYKMAAILGTGHRSTNPPTQRVKQNSKW